MQPGNVAVTDEGRPQFTVAIRVPVLNFEIKNADAEARFALINTAVARADHHALPGFLFAAQIDHRVGDRRIALYRVGSCPKQQVARFQVLQFERIILFAHDGLEEPCPAKPDVLLARIPRHIADIILFKHVINESGTIQSAAGRIGRTVFIIEIARGQLECRGQEFLDLEWIIFEALDLIRQKRGVWGVLFFRRS